MQIKRPRIRPAIRLIGRINAEGMTAVLQYLEKLGAVTWRVVRVKETWFKVRYTVAGGQSWCATFGISGACWMD